MAPTVLFIAAAESAPDTAPASPPVEENAAQAHDAPKPAAPAQVTAAPLRTLEQPAALPGDQRADAGATAAILAAIRSDPGMRGSDVSVNTERGIVSLTGLVRNREQAAIASAYANRQLGVLRVENELSIPAQ